VYAGEVAYAVTRDTALAPLTGILGGMGAALLLFTLWRRAGDVLPWALLLAGVAYAVPLFVLGSGVDEGAPLVAGGLLLCGELAAWSCDERWTMRAERTVGLARARAVALLVLGGAAAASLVLALAAAPIGGGLAWTVLGSVAAVAVVGLAARLSR
jgi:hypothetical protein